MKTWTFDTFSVVSERWPREMGPYDPRLIGRRVEKRRSDLQIRVADLIKDSLLGISSRGRWSEKKDGKEPFSTEQISRLCVLLKGWTGFPFIDEKDGQLLDAIKARLNPGSPENP